MFGTHEEGRFAFLCLFKIAFLRFVCSSLLRFDPGRFSFTSNNFIECFDFIINQFHVEFITNWSKFDVLQIRTCVTISLGSLLHYRVKQVLQSGTNFIINWYNFCKLGKHMFPGNPVELGHLKEMVESNRF